MKSELNSLLKRNSLFGQLDHQTLDNLAKQFSDKKYNAGQLVFQQWNEAKRLYIIVSGKISIETYSLDGKVIKIASLGSGDIFGEFSLVDKKPRSASAVAMVETHLASLSADIFDSFIDAHPSVIKSMLIALVDHIRKSNDQIESLVSLSLLQRTSKLLLNLNEKEGSLLSVTQKQLSEQLFASREKVNAKLKELELKGAIKRGHRKIEIISTETLQRLLQ